MRQEHENARSTPSAGAPPARVLIVEDEVAVASSYGRVLERGNYRIEHCTDIAQVLATLHDSEFDAAILDYGIGDDTTEELIRTLLRRDPPCKSIVITGRGEPEVGRKCLQAGAHRYLKKPATWNKLLEAVADTVKATAEWRLSAKDTADAPSQAIDLFPIAFDIEHAVQRLRIVHGLTTMQTNTARRLLLGDSDRDLADRFSISVRTAKHHVSEVLSRTQARSRADLLRILLSDAGLSPHTSLVDEPRR